MIALVKPTHSVELLHRQFLTLLPRIETHAKINFRDIRCTLRREDAVQDCIALGWRWFLRIHQRGKNVEDFPAAFVVLVVTAVRSGRRLTGQLRAKDVMSERCQRRHGFKIETLAPGSRSPFESRFARPHGQEMQDAFEERLQDNHTTPVPDQVAFRMDWPRFFSSLSGRDRRMAEFLSLGHSGKHAAHQFGLSPGRVTQLRQRWRQEWQSFHGDETLA